MPHHHLIKPGSKIDLRKLSTQGKDFHQDREAAEREFERDKLELDQLQTRLYAENRQRLLIILQAMDAGGKDGTTRSVFKEVNPQGVHIVCFKAPTPEELARDYLWRIHQHVPANRMITVFNRSHYEDVVVVRVDQLVAEDVWKARFDQINQFESYLAQTGTRILKFFLHISRDEQKKSFEDRLRDPTKHWKFAMADLQKRRQWDDYMEAYSEAISRCSTNAAPWYVIPADHVWYRNWAVARIVVQTLQAMNPQFPPLPKEYEGLHVD